MSTLTSSVGGSASVHVGGGVAGSSRSGSGGIPTWEDQIVPTLKKRLESESAYLSNRLSGTNFPEFATSPDGVDTQAAQSLAHAHAHASTSTAQALPPSSIPRARTKSTPLAGSGGRRPSSSKRPSQDGGGVVPGGPGPAGSRSPSGTTIQRELPQPYGSSWSSRKSPNMANVATLSPPLHSDRRPSLNSESPPSFPSRMISRQRSKSSLGPRPIVTRSPSENGSSQIMPPSNIPIYTGRSVSPSHSPGRSPQASPRRPAGVSQVTAANLELLTAAARDSVELDGGARVREGFITNELPPFRMMPDEAMRIAEKGHDVDDEPYSIGMLTDEEDGDTDQNGAYDPDAGTEKRKRAETMKADTEAKKPIRGLGIVNSAGASRPSTSGTNNKISGLPRSATGLGYGRPSTAASRMAQQQKGRSASSNVAGTMSPPGGSGFTGSRSASMNVLASPPSSSSRLGVAAHLVPPENTYTPPKGANWDDVLLPTVAKRIGANDSENVDPTPAPTGEGDLAVEWDKDGTPIKWIKRSEMIQNSTLGGGSKQGGPPPGTSSSFDPSSFDPSPENPLSTIGVNHDLRQQRSNQSLRPRRSATNMHPPSHSQQPHQRPGRGNELTSQGLRPKRSGENIQMSQFPSGSGSGAGGEAPRTTLAQSTNLQVVDGYAHQQPHASSSSYTAPDWGSPLDRQSSPGKGRDPSVSRKASVLRKDKDRDRSGNLSRQGSSSNMGNPLSYPYSGSPHRSGNLGLGQDGGAGQYEQRPAPGFARGHTGGMNSFDGRPQGLDDLRGGRGPVGHVPGTTHMIQEQAYRDKYRTAGNYPGAATDARAGVGQPGRDESVGKGCGCLIM